MKISIITIVYNNRPFISECLQSILDQSFKHVEIIVIDGGSTDGTQDVIELYRDKLGYYISEKDEGLYHALNKGIRQATGDIIGILHSDDLFHNKEVLSQIVGAFEKHSVDLVYAKGIYVDRHNVDKVKRIYASNPFCQWHLFFGWIPLHTTIFVRKDVFDRYGLYNQNYQISGDYDMCLRWFKNKLIKKYFLNEYVVKMRIGGLSTTSSLQWKKSKEDLIIISSYKLLGVFTLMFKIGRKIPQYIKPYLGLT